MGDRAWWIPRWLDRVLPKISVEGEDYFAERDAAQARDRGLPAEA